MTPTPHAVDLEEQRLRDAVVEAALNFWEMPPGDFEAVQSACINTAKALRDYRAKSSSPVPVSRCEPPDGKNGIYWLENVTPGRFDEGWTAIQPWDFENGFWHDMYGAKFTPESQHVEGWRYLEPAIYRPCRPDIRQSEMDELRAQKDGAYLERNQVVAGLASLALAAGYHAGKAKTAIDGWSDDWHGCVYIDLPTGQVSWHYHDSQTHLFEFLTAYSGEWDGHDTPEKYRRVLALRRTPGEQSSSGLLPSAPSPPKLQIPSDKDIYDWIDSHEDASLRTIPRWLALKFVAAALTHFSPTQYGQWNEQARLRLRLVCWVISGVFSW